MEHHGRAILACIYNKKGATKQHRIKFINNHMDKEMRSCKVVVGEFSDPIL